ncbi:hypothetical protein ACH0AH_06905 [Microbacterium paludicola]|uniref:hypothetical protein n=1 Tax=Microbacterium paludicola TaxID=300019 RepID=UPI00387A5810
MHPIAVAPYLGGMVSRRASLGLVALLVVGLTGCTGAPAPDPSGSPSPAATGFASEEEAFAAAEETYRAYNAAVNAYNSGDTSVDPLDYLSGGVRETDASIRQQAEDAGLRFEGETTVRSVDPQEVTTVAGLTDVVLNVCLDDTNLRLINADGEDVTLADAPKIYSLGITMSGRAADSLRIVESRMLGEQC